MSTDDGRPSLEDRRAAYASWRTKLHQRVAENKALAADEPEVAPLDDRWDPQKLFEDSRRLADAG